MRILFDQGTPVPRRALLTQHNVSTAHELGWGRLKNGELLAKAEADGFEALVTTDQKLKYQQHLPGRKLAIAVLMTTSWPRIERHSILVFSAINALTPGQYVEVPIP